MMSNNQNSINNRGYWGIGIYQGKTEYNVGKLMRSADCFGANFVFTVGRRYKKQATDTTKTYKHVPLYNYRDIEDLAQHLPMSCLLIGVEQTTNSMSLSNYCHPERAIYLLGAEDGGLPNKMLDKCHQVVEVPNTKYCLNVAIAGSIVIWDRINKGIYKG